MSTRVRPFLMFQGSASAEEAMNAYIALIPGSRIVSAAHRSTDKSGEETLKPAVASLAGQDVMFFDSPVEHAFGFTPAVSLFIDCDDLEAFERIFVGLSEGGGVLMAPDDYGFSRRFAWINDRFGVSWQINLP